MQEDGTEQIESETAPRVWLVLGDKAGDNAQVRSLAQALPWAYVEKRVVPLAKWAKRKPRLKPSIDHLNVDRSDPIEAPWPDLILTAGRVPSRCALWIKAQTRGECRVVVIGKPRGMIRAFDLVVVASHYDVNPASNVLKHGLPLMFTEPAALAHARQAWESRLASLPRPIVALMVGGTTRGLRLDTTAASRIYEQTQAEAERLGGCVFVTTSRRTSEDVVELLRNRCGDDQRFYALNPDSETDENPYQALLALADHFVVTLDSLSMIVDVARLGGALSIAPLERRTHPIEDTLIRFRLWRRLDARTDPMPTGGLAGRIMMSLGRPIHARDMSAIPQLLVERKHAGWLGESWIDRPPDVEDEREQIVERVLELFAATASPGSTRG